MTPNPKLLVLAHCDVQLRKLERTLAGLSRGKRVLNLRRIRTDDDIRGYDPAGHLLLILPCAPHFYHPSYWHGRGGKAMMLSNEEVEGRAPMPDGFLQQLLRLIPRPSWGPVLHDACDRFSPSTELEELVAWKKSAMTVMNQCDFQAVGKELDIPLGASIPKRLLPAIRSLKARFTMADQRAATLDLALRSIDAATDLATARRRAKVALATQRP